jgi:hypothetical protein
VFLYGANNKRTCYACLFVVLLTLGKAANLSKVFLPRGRRVGAWRIGEFVRESFYPYKTSTPSPPKHAPLIFDFQIFSKTIGKLTLYKLIGNGIIY